MIFNYEIVGGQLDSHFFITNILKSFAPYQENIFLKILTFSKNKYFIQQINVILNYCSLNYLYKII